MKRNSTHKKTVVPVYRSSVKFIVTLLLLTEMTNQSMAQQTPVLNHYFYNPYLINPALAGQSNDTRVFFVYRRQWVGVPDSPETQVFTIDGPLGDRKIGLGLNINNDVSHIVGRLSAMLSGSYLVNFSKDQSLSFGMSAGILRNQLQFDKIRADVSDPGILLNVENKSALEGNAGISYRFRKFRAGFVSEQLFNNSIAYQNAPDFRQVSFELVRHYMLSFQYAFRLSSDLELTPLVLLRSAQGLPSQLDVNATFKYRDMFWANAAYRHKTGVALSAGALVAERFMVGYSYEMPTSDLRYISSGSHEIMIGMKLLGKNSEPSQRTTNHKVVDTFKKESQAQYEKLDAIQQQNEQMNKQLAEYKKVIEQQNSEIENLKKTIGTFDNELKTTIDQLKVDLQKESSFDETLNYYMVIGATKTLADAKTFQKVIKRETKLKPEIIQSENGAWYFIYSDKVASPEEVQKKMKELEGSNIKPFIIGNPWVYKSNKSSH